MFYTPAMNDQVSFRIIPPGEAPAFLDDLPIDALPISHDMQRRLRLLGLRRVGDLAQLPAGAVAAQFGAEGARAWELAHGQDRSPVVPYRPPRSLSERLAFPSPVIATEQLIAATRRLLEHALKRSVGGKVSRLAARTFLLRLLLEDGQAWERQSTFREPVSSVDRMLVAIRPKIDSAIASGALAPCTEIEVSLLDVCGESVSQLHLFPSQRARSEIHEERVAEAARQLKARYGRPMLARILEVEPWSRIPERRFALIDYDP